jgi:ribosomal protein S18 acetylase RimI-like enzyme
MITKIRKLKEEDIPAAAGIISETMGRRQGKAAETKIKLSLKGCGLYKDHEFLVAHEGNTILGIIGFFSYAGDPKDVYWLDYFAVAPEHQKKGTGTHLMEFVENKLKEKKGVRLLCLDTGSTDNYKEARKFYRKHGFKVKGRIENYAIKENMDMLFLAKVL